MDVSEKAELSHAAIQRHPSGRPTIGILAGMGARSTAPFLEAVVDESQLQLGARHEIDYPPMVIFSWPIPYYFDLNYLVEGEPPLPLLDAGRILAVRVVSTWKTLLEAPSQADVAI